MMRVNDSGTYPFMSLETPEYVESSTFLNRMREAAQVFYAPGSQEEQNTYAQDWAAEKPQMYYYALVDGEEFTNVPGEGREFFANKRAHFLYEYGNISSSLSRQFNFYPADETEKVYAAMDDDDLAAMEQQWYQSYRYYSGIVPLTAWLAIAGFIIIILLCVVTGRRPADKELHLCGLDKMFFELHLLFFLIIFAVGWAIFGLTFGISFFSVPRWFIVMGSLLLVLCTLLCEMFLLAMVRKAKDHDIIKHSMIGRVAHGIKSLFTGEALSQFKPVKSVTIRLAIYVAVSFLLVVIAMTTLMEGVVLIAVLLEIFITVALFYATVRDYERIKRSVEDSMQEQIKAERAKSELVTNVSHDLKTPLTSIISYTELLSREELPEPARDYVQVIAKKSQMLKNMVVDVFDLSMSAAGDLKVDAQRLDLAKLAKQTIADMQDKIESSGFAVEVQIPDVPVPVIADGRLMYRVLQNVVDNALKYSLTGTRIFLSVVQDGSIASIRVQNTSAYHINFTAEELLGRFVRGDESRSTEGNGLGLSIAQSFTQSSGGNFQLEIEGDTFKVSISLAMVQ